VREVLMHTLDKIKETLKQEIYAAVIRAGLIEPELMPAVELETPRHKEHGDFATNIAMQLAKPARKPPRQIAEAIAANLDTAKAQVSAVEVAGPGFINFRLDRSCLYPVIAEVLRAGSEYG